MKEDENKPDNDMLLGKWRGYKFYISYSLKSKKAFFYTYINNTKEIIINYDVISIIVDTCIEEITKIALLMAQQFNEIKYAGQYKNKEYWKISNKDKSSGNILNKSFIRFDGQKFIIELDEKKINVLENYFNSDEWKTE